MVVLFKCIWQDEDTTNYLRLLWIYLHLFKHNLKTCFLSFMVKLMNNIIRPVKSLKAVYNEIDRNLPMLKTQNGKKNVFVEKKLQVPISEFLIDFLMLF